MISVSGTTAALLAGPRFVARPSVIILPHAIYLGPPAENVSSRVQSIVINASMDNSVMQATVTLSLGEGIDSLSPFYQASMHRSASQPLLAPGAEILINFFIGPDESDLGEEVGVFQGRVDRVSVSHAEGLATLQCRDLGAWWLNTVLAPPFPDAGFGSAAGTEASQAMLQIMDYAGQGLMGTVTTLTSADPQPQYVVYPIFPQPGPVLDILRAIAQQAGRDVRWFRSANSLLYYEPNRLVTTPDLIIDGRRYESITELSWGDEDVRNYWEVYWQNADNSYDGPAGASDGNSTSQYGPRRAIIYLTRAENIRDGDHALAYANAALADSKDPFASHEISMPLEPRVELNDFHRYEANGREYDTDMEFAVAAFRHEWTAGQQGRPGVTRTTIGARAKPIAAYRDYRRSVPPQSLVSTLPVPEVLWAPEGTVYYQVDTLDPA